MLIWRYFTKPKYYLGNHFTEPKILFWQEKQLLYTQKPKCYFGTCLQNSNIIFDTCFTCIKSLTHGKYNYSSLKKYLSYKIYKSPCASMAKLLIL